MKIECIKEKLNQAVGRVEKITGKNLTLPVLSCVLLEAKNDMLTLRATNLELGIEVTIPVKVEQEGMIAVPGGILSNFISHLQKDNNVKLELSGANLTVSTSNNTTLIKTFAHEDFPTIPRIEDGKNFKINAQEFLKGLKSVWYSSATSSMKPELSSVYIYPDEDSIVFVATDSFRLAEKRVRVKKASDFTQILIPFKNVPEIMRVLEDAKDEIDVHLNKNQISFAFDGVYLTSRVVDGTFPDYKQIIPKEHKTEAIVLKQDLVSSLKLANIFSDNFHQVRLKVEPKKKSFEIRTKNSDVGENTNKIDSALTGDDVEINFNFKYITDCFQSIDSDSVSLEFVALNRPMVMRGVGDKSFMYLVMPMNK